MPDAPLAGVRVLDLTRLLPGNYATAVLTELGAEVLKVEAAEGDGTRLLPPHLPGGESGAWVQLNRGKGSVVLNLKAAEDSERLRGLIRGADVLIDSFRPGVLDRLGFGQESLAGLRPGLVHVSIDAYGSGAGLEQVPGHDLNTIGYAGLLTLAGERPALPGVQMADIMAGLHSALAVVTGLRSVDRDGQFFRAEVAMSDAALTLAQLALGHLVATGSSPPRPDTLTGALACYDVYECADGRWMTVGALEPKFFARTLELMGLGESAASQYDPASQEALRATVAGRFAEEPQAHWVELLATDDTCVGPALTLDEAVSEPNLAGRNVWRRARARDGQLVDVVAAVPWFDAQLGALQAPELGADADVQWAPR